MNLTNILWVATLVALCFGASKRPSFAVGVYLLTFFINPDYWWWGKSSFLFGPRWSLIGGLILLGSVAMNRPRDTRPQPRGASLVNWVMVLILLNATFVHIALAVHKDISAGPYILLAKFVLLYFLIMDAVRDSLDLKIVILAMILGAGYIGYEVTINDRGGMSGGRLEGVGAPGAQRANELASLMVTVLPFIGVMALASRKNLEKITAAIIAVFTMNVLLLCNSRGGYLSMILSAVVLLFAAKGKTRKKAVYGLILGGLSLYFLMGDPRILDRFMSIFVEAENQDESAQSRLVYWEAGLRSIAAYPLGSGGDGFKSVNAKKYLSRDSGRSVHNGFINETCEWGIQGIVLRMTYVIGACVCAWRVIKFRSEIGDPSTAFLGVGFMASMAAFLLSCFFGDRLDAEWGYWIAALLLCYAKIYGPPITAETVSGIGRDMVDGSEDEPQPLPQLVGQY